MGKLENIPCDPGSVIGFFLLVVDTNMPDLSNLRREGHRSRL